MPATYRMRMTKYELMSHLFSPMNLQNTLRLPDGERAYVQTVQKEDGGAKTFNLTVCVLSTNKAVGVFVRTTD